MLSSQRVPTVRRSHVGKWNNIASRAMSAADWLCQRTLLSRSVDFLSINVIGTYRPRRELNDVSRRSVEADKRCPVPEQSPFLRWPSYRGIGYDCVPAEGIDCSRHKPALPLLLFYSWLSDATRLLREIQVPSYTLTEYIRAAGSPWVACTTTRSPLEITGSKV